MSSNSSTLTSHTRARGFGHELLSSIKWLAISSGVWFFLGVLSVVQQRRIDAMLGRQVMDWQFYAHVSLVNVWIYVVLGPLIVVYTWKIHSAFKNKGMLALLHVLGFFSYVNLHALLRFFTAALHDPRTGDVSPRTFPLYLRTFTFFFNDDIYMYLTFAAGAFGYHYYREIRDRELTQSRLQAQLSTAQLQILKMQLQPHFLFNTLHAISTLVTIDPKRAKKMIVLLSELLRVAIDYGVTQEVPLKEEVDFVGKYLDIEKMRFEEDLATHFEVDPQTLDALVPNLLLQPLVENAVKHGVRILPGQGHIHVGAQREGDWLIMHVRDNGPGMAEQITQNSDGLGLRITRARLKQLYGSRHSFNIQNLPAGGVDIHIRIPFRTAVVEEVGVHA